MNFNLNHSKYLAKLDKLFPPISWFQMLNFVDDLDEPLEGLYKYDINEIWDLGDISISVPVYSLLV
tara:strand:- start:383 stop:580 length:198 start_codon:yes stop_codon:yes gene_type:complete